nr:MAG TPA: hypothetical protein [Caudoviricetes sp.]
MHTIIILVIVYIILLHFVQKYYAMSALLKKIQKIRQRRNLAKTLKQKNLCVRLLAYRIRKKMNKGQSCKNS